jgi:hypothetical protein
MGDDVKKPCDAGDELKVLAANGDDRLVVRHTADHQQVMGVLRPVRDGEPITGDVLSVEPIDEANGVYRVKDQFSATGKSHSGAVTDNFRRGWDVAFSGNRHPVGQA